MTPTVLVTGGSGFVGTWVLRELLARQATPVVVDLQPGGARWQRVLGEAAAQVRYENASLLDPAQLQEVIERHQVTHLIHLAALLTPACQQDPWLGCQVNVLGSTAVFEAARRSGRIKAIAYASSYAVYGPESGEANRPPSFYGAFKQSVDLIAEQYWRHGNIASLAIRPHVVYGPERDQGLTAGPSLAARAAALGQSWAIDYTGGASYDYVEDVAAAFVRAAFECPPGARPADLPGHWAEPEDFVRLIDEVIPGAAARLTVSGAAIPANLPPNPQYLTELFPDWRPTPLAEGVRRTIAFYRA
ncbi:MAG: NAD-dependent epimerase/dehydratase [Candidatus Latescibacteria bacterium]|nr:NAD-dependent epimerase/dehydratase [Candidatus Latescibacterota bacterium]